MDMLITSTNPAMDAKLIRSFALASSFDIAIAKAPIASVIAAIVPAPIAICVQSSSKYFIAIANANTAPASIPIATARFLIPAV